MHCDVQGGKYGYSLISCICIDWTLPFMKPTEHECIVSLWDLQIINF